MDTDVALANRLSRDLDGAFPALVEGHQDRLYTIAVRWPATRGSGLRPCGFGRGSRPSP
jgi:hypothetical protein